MAATVPAPTIHDRWWVTYRPASGRERQFGLHTPEALQRFLDRHAGEDVTVREVNSS